MNRRTQATVIFVCLAVLPAISSQTHAQQPVRSSDIEFRTTMAKAVRAAANRYLPSIVTVEIIGAVGAAGGEVDQEAPTSGIIIDSEGYILASNIVVKRPSASILAVLPDGSRHVAKVVSKDHHRNLVLLKIKTDKTLQPVTLPSEMGTKIGATTIGVARYGPDAAPMVCRGVLSAVDRLDGIALQTDARVSPAFYGGALIDLRGNFLGILIPAVAKGGAPDDTSWYDSGIAFAIPADVVQQKLDRLKAGEDISRGLIGIVPKSSDSLKAGTELAAVRTRSPAEKAGLKPGDEITSLAGKPVKRFQQIRQILGRYDAGESIQIEYQRKDKKKTVEIELVDSIPPLQPQRLGFVAVEVVAESEEDEAEGEDESDKQDDSDESESKQQVVVQSIVPNSDADGKLKPDDVIVKLSGADISDVQSMRRLMVSAEPEKDVSLVVVRDGKDLPITLSPESIAGDAKVAIPKSWLKQSEKEWKVQPLKLPDAGNAAAYVAPDQAEDLSGLGLLVLLLNPGEGKPEEALAAWPNLARQYGVVVCAIAPEGNERWRPKEIDVVSRFAKAILKKAAIEESAVAVAAGGAISGAKAEAADSMAMAVAISASETFFGVAISAEARPPAVRLRENEADASLQIMLPIKSTDDLPTWGAALEKAGYPIILGGETDSELLLKWVRLLQII